MTIWRHRAWYTKRKDTHDYHGKLCGPSTTNLMLDIACNERGRCDHGGAVEVVEETPIPDNILNEMVEAVLRDR